MFWVAALLVILLIVFVVRASKNPVRKQGTWDSSSCKDCGESRPKCKHKTAEAETWKGMGQKK